MGAATVPPSKPRPDPMNEQTREPLSEQEMDDDFSGCFWLAVADAKERVARGEPLPAWLRSTREERAA